MNIVIKMDNNIEKNPINIIDYNTEEKISIYKHNLRFKTRICPNCKKILLKETIKKVCFED